jgi:hypothetical protein
MKRAMLATAPLLAACDIGGADTARFRRTD